ncbi:premnaspirodiene oxygenase [Ricinus communis]|uniref:CYP726A16 n=1 Tax=Ricinus communis TaxID=3988 RepID=B9RHW8_RICCO|nr:premnaspirodiene oxygenase [Ricinus communis]AIM47547.1 CYP726A16 [Ricinus communis]EEF48740.1 cytochrome P450, putative [Ricinus communis]|eukprot:NP_001310625.1 premnaspirodiene oxygenase [Ricinus communis]
MESAAHQSYFHMFLAMEQQILSFPVLLSFLLFIFMVLKVWKKNKDNPNSPPGPRKLPIIGNMHQLAGSDLPHHPVTELSKTYGPIMSIQLGQISAIVISSVEGAKEVLKTQGELFAERPLLLAAEAVLYNRMDIIFGAYGDHWRQLRKLCTLEVLSAKRIQSFSSLRQEELSHFVRFVHSKAGSPINLSKVLFALTNSIIARIATGKKCKNQDALLDLIEDVIEVSGGFSIADLFPSLKFIHVITGMKSRLEKLHRITDQVLEDIVNEHKATRAASKNGGGDDDKKEAKNLLDVLLDLQEDGSLLQVPLTDDSIKAAILEMLGGGSDTSAKTTEWAMSEMMRYPETMKKAQEEVRQAFGNAGKIDEARIHELKYLRAVFKETLRLHPPLAMIPRECRQKTKINGYDIYPKTKTLINVYAIGRDPNVWSEPEKFYPERHLDSPIDFRGSNFELIPFGAGKRICPGMTLAITTVELFLAHLLYYFDWKFVDGMTADTLDMTESFGASIKRKIDLALVPIPVSPLP